MPRASATFNSLQALPLRGSLGLFGRSFGGLGLEGLVLLLLCALGRLAGLLGRVLLLLGDSLVLAEPPSDAVLELQSLAIVTQAVLDRLDRELVLRRRVLLVAVDHLR